MGGGGGGGFYDFFICLFVFVFVLLVTVSSAVGHGHDNTPTPYFLRTFFEVGKKMFWGGAHAAVAIHFAPPPPPSKHPATAPVWKHVPHLYGN